jgi:hypothetical protein
MTIDAATRKLVRCAIRWAIAILAFTTAAIFAGAPCAAQTAGGTHDPAAQGYGVGYSGRAYPIGYLNNFVIDKMPSGASSKNGRSRSGAPSSASRKLPAAVGRLSIVRLKQDEADNTTTSPKAVVAPTITAFDPAIYAVYGIMAADDGVAAIVGLVGGDTQVLHIGNYVDDTDAKIVRITRDAVYVRSDSAGRIDRIGFDGGEPAALSEPAQANVAAAVQPVRTRY